MKQNYHHSKREPTKIIPAEEEDGKKCLDFVQFLQYSSLQLVNFLYLVKKEFVRNKDETLVKK